MLIKIKVWVMVQGIIPNFIISLFQLCHFELNSEGWLIPEGLVDYGGFLNKLKIGRVCFRCPLVIK